MEVKMETNPMAEIPCSFTEAELVGMRQLMEAGLKAIGDPAAEAYVHLTRKIKAAMQVAQQPIPNGHDKQPSEHAQA